MQKSQPAAGPLSALIQGSVAFVLACAVIGTVQAEDLGLIHGTISLDNDTELTGVMRWGGQEVLWIHHFNGDKAQPFDLNGLSDEDREHIEKNLPGPRFNINGHTVELVRWLGSSELQPQPFGIEFGQIERLEPGAGDRVTVILRDGSEVKLDGGSDDIDTEIELLTATGTRHDVDWDDIESVRFHAPNAPTQTFPPHLHGTVRTRGETFTGYVEWDHDERFPGEELDGDDPSGAEHSINFGSIAVITSLGESSEVERTDGSRVVLSDTNDVNGENRGIVVTSADLGRVDIPWTAFESVRFEPPSASPPGYGAFAADGTINARVIAGDRTLDGALIYDLDHRHRGEMIIGYDSSGIEYRIPWYRLAVLEPASGKTSRLTLRDGRTLNLGRDPDVTGSNQGLVVANAAAEKPIYLQWESVTRIETTW